VPLLANRVHQGDCIEKLKSVQAGSVDLVFADPPFNIGYAYDVYHDRQSRDRYLTFSRDWMAAVKGVLKPTGTFWLAIGDEYAAELKLIAQDEIGFACRSWVIWYYTFGVNCARGFSRSHTHLLHFVRDPRRFTFNGENPAVRVPSARQLVYADARANSKGRLPDNTWILRPQDVPAGGFAPMHDTWFFARVAGTFAEREGFHGCQMPEQLLGRIIRISSHPGELVLDPFAGSGTTLAVAKKLGRQWLGIELSTDYVQRIRERLRSCPAGDDLDGPADPIRSAPTTGQGKKRTRFRNGRPVLALDQQTEDGIVEAYKKCGKGYSTDLVLCDPELNENFVAACKRKSLPGDPSVWNRLLLRIRKSGKLPKLGRGPRRLTPSATDAYSAASEAAMQLLSLDYGFTLDEFLCSPLAAAQFDRLAARFGEGYSSLEYRWAAMAIRKRAKRSRALAATHFRDWDPRQLGRSIQLDRCLSAKYEHPGVYVVLDHRQPLYVGETLNVRHRVQQIRDSELWREFGPTSLKLIDTRGQQSLQYGLQSHLIGRTNPVLNSLLLRPDE
jgi:site-specific DNA-methyltransferase (adenine-specific)